MFKVINKQKNSKVCIIGAGNGGLAAAADLTLRGNQVILAELPEFYKNIKKIKEEGGILLKTLKSTGLKGGFARIHKATTDIGEAISESNIILIITPSFAHEKIAKECAPYLKVDHTVVLAPGNIGGSIDFYNSLMDNGVDENIVISEMECMMYACRKQNDSTIYIRGFKYNLGFSSFPSVSTDVEIEKVRKIYPNLIKRNNILETGFSNINPILHVPILVSNISNVENGKETLMYYEGLTKSIGELSELMDQERMELNTFSKEIYLKPMRDIYKSWYYHQGARGNSLVELANKNPIYYESMLPNTLQHRYLLEDIPFGLIPMSSILEKFNIENNIIKSMIYIAKAITNKSFKGEARNLESLRLNDKSPEEILRFIKYGAIKK